MVNWWGLAFGGNNKRISSFVLLWSSTHVNSHVFPTQLEGWLPINNMVIYLFVPLMEFNAWIPVPWEMYTHLKNGTLLFWMHFWNGCNNNSAIILVHSNGKTLIWSLKHVCFHIITTQTVLLYELVCRKCANR